MRTSRPRRPRRAAACAPWPRPTAGACLPPAGQFPGCGQRGQPGQGRSVGVDVDRLHADAAQRDRAGPGEGREGAAGPYGVQGRVAEHGGLEGRIDPAGDQVPDDSRPDGVSDRACVWLRTNAALLSIRLRGGHFEVRGAPGGKSYADAHGSTAAGPKHLRQIRSTTTHERSGRQLRLLGREGQWAAHTGR